MNGHPQFDEDFDLYALGALDGEEAQVLELHLASCLDCSRRRAEARGRMAALALAAPAELPSASVRGRLLGRTHAEGLERPASSLRVLPRWLIPVFALISLALAVSLWFETIENRELNRSIQTLQIEAQRQEVKAARARAIVDVLTAPDTQKVILVAGAARPVSQGKAFYHSRRGLVFYATNLPALPAGRTYQLWLVPTEGNPLSAGIFPIDTNGNGTVLLPALPAGVAAKAFAVTVEPAGGMPQPTGPKVLIGLVS